VESSSRMGFVIVLLALSIMPCIGDAARAQDDGDPVTIGTYRTLHSRVLNEDRVLLINLPNGYDETAIGYPVMYVLYGGQVRGYFAEAVHVVDRLQEAGLIPSIIIVGVKNVDRYRDNLPVGRNGEEGGAENFLRFFTEELIPFVDSSYRTKDFRILVGPQAGASFGLYALMEQPRLFGVDIVTNPFWNKSAREYLLIRAENFFYRKERLKNFFFIRSKTRDDNPETMKYLNELVSAVEEGNRPGFTLILDERAEEEADPAIPSPGLRAGLKAYFKEYRLPEEAEIDSLDDIESYYRDLSMDYGYEVDVPERTLILQADALQQRLDDDAARAIYEYVVKQYPHNLDSYVRLAEMHRRLGEYDEAIEYYEEFLARRPEPMIQRGLDDLRRYVNESAAYAVKKAILGSGIEAGMARYHQLRSAGQGEIYFDETEFNSLGYGLIGRKMIDAAIEVFKMNVEMNPESANAYDSLGEAYMLSGDNQAAIETYEKSLELNSDNANALDMLQKLKQGGD